MRKTLDGDPEASEYEGYHSFVNEEEQEYGSFEVFFDDDHIKSTRSGWYWWSCFPGCLPDGEPTGPFDTSKEAYDDAREA